MKLIGTISLAGACALLTGCASGPNLADSSQLAVYPDNRVGFQMWSASGPTPVRVWSNQDVILALRFGSRVINAKDIDSMVVRETKDRYLPLNVSVSLKSGESFSGDAAQWGSSLYKGTFIEWMACTNEKVCEYVDRKGSISGFLKFNNFPNFLTSIDESFIADLAKGRSIEGNYKYTLDAALPYSTRFYKLKFSDAKKISNFQNLITAAREKNERFDACVSERLAKENLERKKHEEMLIKTTPSAELAKRLELWRATLNTGFAHTSAIEMECRY